MGNISWREKIKPVNWLAYVMGMTLKFVLPLHIVEQLVYRTHIDPCKACVASRECNQGDRPCWCDMPGKAYVPFKSCSNGHWGPMRMTKKSWAAYKEQFGVEIIIKEKQF